MDRWRHVLGIGISEGTAITVRGNSFEVSGETYIQMQYYRDGKKVSFRLYDGDEFNIHSRERQ